MNIPLPIAALLLVASTAHGEVTVTLGSIRDVRYAVKSKNTLEFLEPPPGLPSSSGLTTTLFLSGPEFADAKAMRVVFKSATDDTGAALRNPQMPFASRDAYWELESHRNIHNGDAFQVILQFDNPPRAANAIKELILSVELIIPKLDPMSVITASVAKNMGKVLEIEALKATGAECTLLKPEARPMKTTPRLRVISGRGDSPHKNTGDVPKDKAALEYRLGFELKDANKKIAAVEFCDANGVKLPFSGRSYQYTREGRSATFTFKSEPPADAVAKIYLVTDKSVLTVPVALKDIALP
jgi:hypothetical protein